MLIRLSVIDVNIIKLIVPFININDLKCDNMVCFLNPVTIVHATHIIIDKLVSS